MTIKTLEVFFDYACPYCLRGFEYLKELAPKHPEIEIVWRPCEAHPRPERYGPHSDLCIQGMYYAREQRADLWAYHSRMFAAALTDRVDIEDAKEVAGAVHGLLDPDALLAALQSGRYAKAVTDGNDLAYQKSGVWALPAFRLEGKKLDSVENVGVTKAQLSDLMQG